MGESQGPSRLVIDRDDKVDAAFILRARRAMRESAALVVRVSPALPVADIDGAIRPARAGGWRRCNQAQGCNYRSDCKFHNSLPQRIPDHRRL